MRGSWLWWTAVVPVVLAEGFDLIPPPTSISMDTTKTLELNPGCFIVPQHTSLTSLAAMVSRDLSAILPFKLKSVNPRSLASTEAHECEIRLAIEPAAGDTAKLLEEDKIVVHTHGSTSEHDLKVKKVQEDAPVPEEVSENEGYALTVDGTGVTIRGKSYLGVVHGSSTLLQILHSQLSNLPSKDLEEASEESTVTIPQLTVLDQPAIDYRGLMVDVARLSHPIENLFQYVTLCRLYKLRYLHLHLSDDQKFTFPLSKKLLEEGHIDVSKIPGPIYSSHDLRKLREFATASGIEIIAEIDVPGHASAILKGNPELAVKTNENTLNFRDPKVMGIVEKILEEVRDVFPSKYMHIGADEVHFTAENKTMVADYRQFISHMDTVARNQNRKLIVWEGFRRGESVEIPKDILVSPFDCFYYPPEQLARDGYHIINTAWSPLYITPGVHPSVQSIYKDWNLFKFGEFPKYQKMHSLEDFEEAGQYVIGAQLCAWEMDTTQTFQTLLPRVPALAERLWSTQTTSMEEFSRRMHVTSRLYCKLLGRAEGDCDVQPQSEMQLEREFDHSHNRLNRLFGPVSRLERDVNILDVL